ncbi:D-sedoheptulose 7-phosphate isomerase [Piscinibacter sakaiensis]|uniref:D-sedoheptulose 7-phosphate isomerase n=1 Tax=Piscinibacter sakaiensis TaxID=1547922 RepID=UPI003AAEA4D0
MTSSMRYDFLAEYKAAIEGLQVLLNPAHVAAVEQAAQKIGDCIEGGGKLLLCGNGGSAADAQHIAAELIGRYKTERRGLAAIALTTDSSVLTAWSNDYQYETVFARQVEALGRAGDLLIGISTSGNSANVIAAVEAARELGVGTIGLLGRDGGKLRAACDVAVVVPLTDTARIQEAHMVTYHSLCGALDARFTTPDPRRAA